MPVVLTLDVPAFLAVVGLGAVLRGLAPVPPAAVNFCDCPSVGQWFAAGLGSGFALGALFVLGLVALLRPSVRAPVSASPPAVTDEVFFDAEDTLAPPPAVYRRWR